MIDGKGNVQAGKLSVTIATYVKTSIKLEIMYKLAKTE